MAGTIGTISLLHPPVVSTKVATKSIFRWALLVAMLTDKYKRSPMLGIPVPPGVVQVGPRVATVQAGVQPLPIRLHAAVILGNSVRAQLTRIGVKYN